MNRAWLKIPLENVFFVDNLLIIIIRREGPKPYESKISNQLPGHIIVRDSLVCGYFCRRKYLKASTRDPLG